jgi:hypothetical protein
MFDSKDFKIVEESEISTSFFGFSPRKLPKLLDKCKKVCYTIDGYEFFVFISLVGRWFFCVVCIFPPTT